VAYNKLSAAQGIALNLPDAPFSLELILPLFGHSGWRGDHDEINPPAQEQLARDKPRLYRFSEPYIIRNQEIYPGETQLFAEGQQLIGIQPNAGPKRRL